MLLRRKRVAGEWGERVVGKSGGRERRRMFVQRCEARRWSVGNSLTAKRDKFLWRRRTLAPALSAIAERMAPRGGGRGGAYLVEKVQLGGGREGWRRRLTGTAGTAEEMYLRSWRRGLCAV